MVCLNSVAGHAFELALSFSGIVDFFIFIQVWVLSQGALPSCNYLKVVVPVIGEIVNMRAGL
jgi:hypothetical protein